MLTQAIHDDLVATPGAEAPVYSMVTKYLGTAQFDPAKDPLNSDASSHHITSTIPIMLSWQLLRKNRFHQCGSLHKPPSSTHDRSQETDQLTLIYTTSSSLGPYLLSGAQKVQMQRVELSSSLLRMLQVQEQRA
jgi:hypothetical protein